MLHNRVLALTSTPITPFLYNAYSFDVIQKYLNMNGVFTLNATILLTRIKVKISLIFEHRSSFSHSIKIQSLSLYNYFVERVIDEKKPKDFGRQ